MVRISILLAIILCSNQAFSQLTVKGSEVKISENTDLIIKGDLKLETQDGNSGIINSESDLKITGDIYFNNSNTFGLELDNSSNLVFSGDKEQKLLGSYSNTYSQENIELINSAKLDNGEFYLIVNSLNLTNSNNLLLVGKKDVEVETISGNGFAYPKDEGSLVMDAPSSQDLLIPLSDGVSNYSITFNQSAVSEERLSIKLLDIEDGRLFQPNLSFWQINASENLDATVNFRLDKSILDGRELADVPSIRYFDGVNYSLYPKEDVSLRDEQDHYVITVSGINRFNYED